MTNDEIAGQFIVLEVFSMTALGLYLANASNDPDYSKSAAMIDYLRQFVSQKAITLPPSGKRAAESYAEYLLASLATNIRSLRGEVGQSH